MSILDPKADAAALQPVVDEAVDRASNDVASVDLPALEAMLARLANGLTVTITIAVSKVAPKE